MKGLGEGEERYNNKGRRTVSGSSRFSGIDDVDVFFWIKVASLSIVRALAWGSGYSAQ